MLCDNSLCENLYRQKVNLGYNNLITQIQKKTTTWNWISVRIDIELRNFKAFPKFIACIDATQRCGLIAYNEMSHLFELIKRCAFDGVFFLFVYAFSLNRLAAFRLQCAHHSSVLSIEFLNTIKETFQSSTKSLVQHTTL